MKPVSYQSMPSSVNGGHPSVALDRVLNTSNVMYCEKCGFASTDGAAFKKHMLEHIQTKFYCFYCNNVSFSEVELAAHLKQHTSKYPFMCPHCGQGYMRRLCLVKHIDRLHNKSIIQGAAKPGVTKSPQIPVSSALRSVPTADASSVRPVVRVTVPTPTAPAARFGKDEQRAKTLDTNLSTVTNGNAELLSPLNGLIQHNRALTVSLPEEVTIPAGCLVELVEVKTVNGTKELKLRLISQQENESVIKDTRTVASQNTALGKPTFSHPNMVWSTSMGMCTVNRKQSETKAVNVERPPVIPVSISNNFPNPMSKEKSVLKRASPEIINLECSPGIPNKVSKSILSPVREGNSGITQTAPVNHSAAALTALSTKVASRLSAALHPDIISQRVADERKNVILEHSKSVPPRRTCDPKSVPQLAVKLEPRAIHLKSNTVSKAMKEAASLNQQSLKSASPSSSVPAVQVRPQAIVVGKNNVANQSPIKTSVLFNHTSSKTWTQEVRPKEVARERHVSEPESFPVISSVFSLSQQPEEVQGSIQPLVMALRGIVMDKRSDSGSKTEDQVKITNSMEQAAQVATKNGPFVRDLLSTGPTSEPVKVEDHDKGVQHPRAPTDNHIHVKEEKHSAAHTDNNQSSHTSASKPSTDEAQTVSQESETAKSEQDIPSKFLTVSLKRVQVGVWKKNKKGLKLRISKYKTEVPVAGLTDCTVIYPMPLKVDQLVKRPGPYQPVVVLNHPKPRVSVRGARADTFADTGASQVVPKCQILKMRLSKVMGQKYEVMGCTVRVFP